MSDSSMRAKDLDLGGRLRQSWEDFRVDEVPLYPPSGSGEHWLLRIEKRGVSTGYVVQQLQKRWRLKPQEIGIAGQKDRGAIARQWMSLPGRIAEADLVQIESDSLSLLEASRHDQKLRRGHLIGNRFEIWVRDAKPGQLDASQELGTHLTNLGMPNSFGQQRFGSYGQNDILGGYLIRGDAEGLFAAASAQVEGENPRLQEARELLGAKEWGRARGAFPPSHALERHLAAAMGKGLEMSAAARSLPRTARDFVVSAWQSRAFNRVLSSRLAEGRGLMAGDLMMFLPRGACFALDDPLDPTEITRVRALEIAPTGPLPGWKMSEPQAEASEAEAAVLSAHCAERSQWSDLLLPRGSFRGERRALWVPLKGFAVEEHEPGSYCFGFELPRGSYATSLLERFGVPSGSFRPASE